MTVRARPPTATPAQRAEVFWLQVDGHVAIRALEELVDNGVESDRPAA
jgi:hypothetical protein